MPGGVRDGDTLWRSYGWSYHRELSAGNNVYPEIAVSLGPHTSTFALLLYALGRSNARPESLEVFLRKKYVNGHGLSPALFPPLGPNGNPAVLAVISNLQTLMLTIAERAFALCTRVNIYQPRLHDFGSPENTGRYKHDNEYERPLMHILRIATKLKKLRLNFDPLEWYGSRFVDWLGQPIASTQVEFAHLTELDLGMVIVSGENLLRVISKPKNLTSLNLWKVCLLVKHDPKVDYSHVNSPPSAWKLLLRGLSNDVPPALSSMLIGFPSEILGYGINCPIPNAFVSEQYRKSGINYPGAIRSQVSYQGNELGQWLVDLAKDVQRESPLSYYESPVASSDEEDTYVDNNGVLRSYYEGGNTAEDEEDDGEEEDDDDDDEEDELEDYSGVSGSLSSISSP